MLGFAGMVAAGVSPEVAWEEIHRDATSDLTRPIFDHLRSTDDGRAALECAAQRWAELGFPPPWEP